MRKCSHKIRRTNCVMSPQYSTKGAPHTVLKAELRTMYLLRFRLSGLTGLARPGRHGDESRGKTVGWSSGSGTHAAPCGHEPILWLGAEKHSSPHHLSVRGLRLTDISLRTWDDNVSTFS